MQNVKKNINKRRIASVNNQNKVVIKVIQMKA